MTDTGREAAALARWRPGRRWYHPLMASLVIGTSRFVMTRMNRTEIERLDRFETLKERGGRGLLTFSNHTSLFDDPLIVSCFGLRDYSSIRWVGADALNFFGSPWKAWVFTAGRSVPIVRGAGLGQPGLRFLADRLLEGAWVHYFPEGGRTRDPNARMSHPFKPGMGFLMAEAKPVLLPFYHDGMHRVLPIGAKVPRRGQTVRVRFGEAIDCDDEYLRSAGGDSPALWEALAERAYVALRQMEDSPARPERV